MKTVIIGTSGHIDLALGVRDRARGVSFVGIAPGSADEDAKAFYIDQLEAALIPWYDDWRAMLDREKPDLAVVAPFFHLQSTVARECLERGIHVFVEKPMAGSLDDLARLRAAHAAGRAELCPMLAYRYHPGFQAAHLAVEEGLIGEPLLLSAQKSYKLGTRHPMYTRRATYGGTIPWVAIHAIDWLWWFTGGGLVEVTAAHTTNGNRGHAELESSGACLYRLANGGQRHRQLRLLPSHGRRRARRRPAARGGRAGGGGGDERRGGARHARGRAAEARAGRAARDVPRVRAAPRDGQPDAHHGRGGLRGE